MSYTVKEMARMSGVSVRTLHWYDEIGLLKPAYHGANGRRFYEEQELLLLQQILFYRELDFSLSDIKKILMKKDFQVIKALKSHRETLRKRFEETDQLIKTIDNTLLHLEGKKMQNHNELFYGFNSEKQKAYEKEIQEKGLYPQEVINEAKRNTKHWTKDDEKRIHQEGNAINQALAAAIEQGLAPDSKEVQESIHKLYLWIRQFYTPTKEIFLGLGDLYTENPEFRQFYAHYHPDLADYLKKGMTIYAENEL